MIYLARAVAIAKIQDLHNFSLFVEEAFGQMNIYAHDFSSFTQETCDYLYDATH